MCVSFYARDSSLTFFLVDVLRNQEKARIKLEKELEKEEKRKKREVEREAKAARDAVEAEKKAQRKRDKDEKKLLEDKKLAAKQAALKSQKNLMSNFFQKTSPTPSVAAAAAVGASSSSSGGSASATIVSGSTKTTAASPSGSSSTTTTGTAAAGPSSREFAFSFSQVSAILFFADLSLATRRCFLLPTTTTTEGGDFAKVFHPFTIRPGVVVAPVNRFRDNKNDASSSRVVVEIDSQPSLNLETSLAEFMSRVEPSRVPRHNPFPRPACSVRQLVVGINDNALTGGDSTRLYRLLEDRGTVPVKLIRFAEDVRPGYVGTWSKTSRVVTPRTPFGTDRAVLNYDMDSEGEWEDEPDDANAENIGSDGERSNEDEDDDDEGGVGSDVDSWLACDDEIEYESGYDEDGDIVMMDGERHHQQKKEDDDDDVIIVESERDKHERLKRERKKHDDKLKKRKAAGPLLPLIKGPVWQDLGGGGGGAKDGVFKSFKIQFLNGEPFSFYPSKEKS